MTTHTQQTQQHATTQPFLPAAPAHSSYRDPPRTHFHASVKNTCAAVTGPLSVLTASVVASVVDSVAFPVSFRCSFKRTDAVPRTP